MKNKLEPFVKWAGGKSQLLEEILALVPKNYNTYIEPFLGGGAIFLALQPNKAIVNDLNNRLINTYNTIKDNNSLLQKELREMVKIHTEEYYYHIRDIYNEKNNSSIVDASQFIYLNKLGFNGLYRLNNSGEFNVPFGKKLDIKNSTLYSKANLDNINSYLNNNDITILSKSFIELESTINENDFVFVDPPYDSDDENSFDKYNKNAFGKDGLKELADFLIRLDKKGVKWMLTNHNTSLVNELFRSFKKFIVPVNRMINSNAKNRSNATEETIIINYDINDNQMKEFNRIVFYKELQKSSYILNTYVSWDEINQRIEDDDILINDLNYLVSNDLINFNIKFEKIFNDEIRRKCLSLLPLLVSKRLDNKEKFSYLINNDTIDFDYNDRDIVYKYICESFLLENLFLKGDNFSIKTYLLGLEVGLTSNDKKNKSGSYMANQIANILKENNIIYQTEVTYNAILNQQLDDDKRFDFVFEKNGIKYCLECNFFNSSGSKINTEAKRFIELNNDLKKYTNIKFIWVSDGIGLKKNKSSVDQAINEIDLFFNIKRFKEFISVL